MADDNFGIIVDSLNFWESYINTVFPAYSDTLGKVSL